MELRVINKSILLSVYVFVAILVNDDIFTYIMTKKNQYNVYVFFIIVRILFAIQIFEKLSWKLSAWMTISASYEKCYIKTENRFTNWI